MSVESIKDKFHCEGYAQKPPLLMTLSTGYSVADVVKELIKKATLRVASVDLESPQRLNWIYPSRPQKQLKKCDLPVQLSSDLQNSWEQFLRSEAFLRMSREGYVKVEGLAKKRLHAFFTRVVPDILHTFLQAKKLMTHHEPVVVLAATMAYRHKAFFYAAKCLKIPSVVYRHGSSGGHVKMKSAGSFVNYQNDLRWADYVFTCGQGDEAYFKRYHPDGAHTIPVGSAVLDRLKSSLSKTDRQSLYKKTGLKPDRPVVIYCPTSMAGNMRVVPAWSRSPGRDFAIQRAIVEVFREFPDIQCVVKLPPPNLIWPMSPIVEYIKHEKIQNCAVLTQNFQSLLPLGDLFITDYPSTTFFEMLTTKQPILVCGYLLPWPFNTEKWHPSNLDMWKERVEYCDDLEKFLELLRLYLCERRFAPVESTDEMLRLFGTHKGDGDSAERAVDQLLRIANCTFG